MNNGGNPFRKKIAFAAALLVVSHSLGAMPIAIAAPLAVNVLNDESRVKVQENNAAEQKTPPVAETTTSTTTANNTTTTTSTTVSNTTTTTTSTTTTVTTTHPEFVEYTVNVDLDDFSNDNFTALVQHIFGQGVQTDFDENGKYKNKVKVPYENSINEENYYMSFKNVMFKLVSNENHILKYKVFYKVEIDDNIKYVKKSKIPEDHYCEKGSEIKLTPDDLHLLEGSAEPKSFTVDGPMRFKGLNENNDGYELWVNNTKCSVSLREFSIKVSNNNKIQVKDDFGNYNDTQNKRFKWRDIDKIRIYCPDKRAMIVSNGSEIERFDVNGNDNCFYLKDILNVDNFKYANNANFDVTGVNIKICVKSVLGDSGDVKGSELNVQKDEGDGFIIRVPYLENDNYRLISYSFNNGDTTNVDNANADKSLDSVKYYTIYLNGGETDIELKYSKISTFDEYSYVPSSDVYQRSKNCYAFNSDAASVNLMSLNENIVGSSILYSYYASKNLKDGNYAIGLGSKMWKLERGTIGDPTFIFIRNILQEGDELKSCLDESICFYDDKCAPNVEVDPANACGGKKGVDIKLEVDDREECPASGSGELFYEQNFIRDVYDNYINAISEDKQEIKSIIIDDYRFDRPENGWKDINGKEGYIETEDMRTAEAELVEELKNVDFANVDTKYKNYPATYDFYRSIIINDECIKVAEYYDALYRSYTAAIAADGDISSFPKNLATNRSNFNKALAAYNKAADDAILPTAVNKRKIIPTLTFNEKDGSFNVNIKALEEFKDKVIENKAIRIFAIDNSNNSGNNVLNKAKIVTVDLDGTAPVISDTSNKKIRVEGENITVIKEDTVDNFIINVGNVISAFVSDLGRGVEKVECYFTDDPERVLQMTEDSDKGKYIYTVSDDDLKKEIKSSVTIKAVDKDGNEASLSSGVTEEKFNVLVDKTAPESSIVNNYVPDNCFFQEIGDDENKQIRKWFKDYGDIRFDITAADRNPDICSGIRYLNIFINDRSSKIELSEKGISEAELNGDGNYYVALKETDINGYFNAYLRSTKDEEFELLVCEDITCAGDDVTDIFGQKLEKDSVRIGFFVEDFAKNISVPEFETVYVDLSDPKVEAAEVNGRNFIKNGEFRYDVFSRSEIDVSIKVKDDAPTSGIDNVYVDLYDENDKLISKDIKAERADSAERWNVKIPDNFKGYLVIRAVDNVKRVSEDIYTNGIIIENGEKHSESSEMAIELPETNFRDRDGRPLYSEAIDINFRAKDSFSGLADIITSVSGMQSSYLHIDDNGAFSGDEADIWKNTENNRDKNLVTELSGKKRIDLNSNNIRVDLDIKDKAGNPEISSPESVNFSIDTTDPRINVRYTDANGNPETESKELYNTARRAVITVTERNFSGDLAEVLVNGSRRSLSWTHTGGTEGTDDAQYQAEVLFEADGNYDLNIKCRDMGGRSAAEYEQKFEIDRTAPKLSVSFDKNISNDHYYGEAVTATLRITDANFDAGSVNISGTFNGRPEGFPGASGWTAVGGDNVSTIRFEKNGEYELTVSGKDRAGNTFETYVGKFCIDTQKPVIAMDSMQRSNNASEIRPRIQFTDANIDKDSIKIELQGAKRGNSLPYSGELIEKKDGYEYVFDNFPQTAEYDDIYTIKASARDNANNKLEKDVKFSVNRFGSTFTVDEATAYVIGRYISEPRDIIVTETNPDKHASPCSVFITRDAEMISLREGADYKVEMSGGGDEWAEYKYIIFAKNFVNDAKYTVSIHTEDEAGNLNVSAALKNNASISFSIDSTAPLCIPLNISENSSYKGERYTAKLSISDNVSLKDVKVLINGSPVSTTMVNDECTFEIFNSPRSQEISVIITDMADNRVEYDYKNILVTTSALRIMARKTWFKIAGAGAFVLAGASVAFFRRRRRYR